MIDGEIIIKVKMTDRPEAIVKLLIIDPIKREIILNPKTLRISWKKKSFLTVRSCRLQGENRVFR